MSKINNKRGQVLIMVTLVLIVMCGVLGLAVDLGWSYFVKKSAQAAVDAGAISAVQAAYAKVGQIAPINCSNLQCQPITPCPASVVTPSNNLETGCLYAKQNGFSFQGHDGRQNVTMAADIQPNPPPTVTGVVPDYWVTARAFENIPQLFSAVLGNTWGGSSARATAAIADVIVPGSLYALNWETDPAYRPKGPGIKGGPKFDSGVGLFMNGSGTINAGGGVYIASSADGTGKTFAAMTNGQVTVKGSTNNIRKTGKADNPSVFTPLPTNISMSKPFDDPMAGKGQPLPPNAATDRPINGGTIPGSSDCTSPTLLKPGSYYAVDAVGKPTGAPIQVGSGCVLFASSSGGSNPNGFGDYVFYGGLQFGATHTVATFEPGRYFFAGVQGTNQPVFSMNNGVILKDGTTAANGTVTVPNNAGEIFVFTDHRYQAFDPATGTTRGLPIPSALLSNQQILQSLDYGWVGVQTGNNSDSGIFLHGLNKSQLPSSEPDLANFAPTLFWMDQANSEILYTSNYNGGVTNPGPDGKGNIYMGCATPPCTNSDGTLAPFMQLLAGPNTHLYGVLYMPRGSYLDMQGSPDVSSPLMVIAGAVSMGGSGNLILTPNPTPLVRRYVTLIE